MVFPKSSRLSPPPLKVTKAVQTSFVVCVCFGGSFALCGPSQVQQVDKMMASCGGVLSGRDARCCAHMADPKWLVNS